jgi:hypothetical protein
MVATLSDSASFWASIATLWGAAGAWLTYFGTVWSNREERSAALSTLLSGLKTELVVVSDWASGEGKGYEQRPASELERERPDWFNPGRLIFSFECPTLRNLTNSPYIRELGPIVDDVVRLSRSITRLFNCYEEYREYVNSRPLLYDSVVKKLAQQKADFTEAEREYLKDIFRRNAQIHQSLIGGIDSQDSLCLYKTFRAAKESVNNFLRTYAKPLFPWWYWILHVIAAAAFLKGLLLIIAWLR